MGDKAHERREEENTRGIHNNAKRGDEECPLKKEDKMRF